jgi:hypothetical protein
MARAQAVHISQSPPTSTWNVTSGEQARAVRAEASLRSASRRRFSLTRSNTARSWASASRGGPARPPAAFLDVAPAPYNAPTLEPEYIAPTAPPQDDDGYDSSDDPYWIQYITDPGLNLPHQLPDVTPERRVLWEPPHVVPFRP